MAEKLFLDERNLRAAGLSEPNLRTFRELTEFVDAQTRLGTAETNITSLLATTLTAGAGLTGGGDLSDDRTFDVGAGTGISVTADAVAIADTAVTPGSYTLASITVDQQGRLTAASSGSVTLPDGDYGDITISGTGTVVSIDAGVVGPTELANTAVTPGSYTLANITVDQQGRLTAAASGALADGDYGDITVSGTGTVFSIDADTIGPTELADTAVTPGSYTNTSLTVDQQGRITAASSGSGGGGVLPMVDGSKPPVFIYEEDGSLVYWEV